LNCDPIARAYRWLEYAAFGRALERRRFAFLPDFTNIRRALVLGDGDGRFLARLAAAAPLARIDYIDLSARMLELARRRAGVDRISYQRSNALDLKLPEAEYDLVATHFFLDCFEPEDCSKLVDRIGAASRPDARWVVSEFRKPTNGWPSVAAGALIPILYFFFRVTSGLKTRRLTDHRIIFERYGFRLARIQPAWRGLLASELWMR